MHIISVLFFSLSTLLVNNSYGMSRSRQVVVAKKQSPLVEAAQHNNVRKARALLETLPCAECGAYHGEHAESNERGFQGKTALIWAILHKNKEFAQLLLQHKADVNIQTNTGMTPLMYAAQQCDPKMIALLAAAKANPCTKTADGVSALSIALKGNDAATIAAIEALTTTWRTHTESFKSAAVQGDIKQMKALLADGRMLLHARTPLGRTHLMCAARGKKPAETIPLLLNAGVEIDAQDKHGNTALIWAVLTNNPDAAYALLACGASATLQNQDGKNALNLVEDYQKDRQESARRKKLIDLVRGYQKAAQGSGVKVKT